MGDLQVGRCGLASWLLCFERRCLLHRILPHVQLECDECTARLRSLRFTQWGTLQRQPHQDTHVLETTRPLNADEAIELHVESTENSAFTRFRRRQRDI